MAKVNLFLSCVSDEFGDYRDALRSALTQLNVETKIQEDFQNRGGDTLAMLEDYIESCDVVVHFAGRWPARRQRQAASTTFCGADPSLRPGWPKRAWTARRLGA
jgi:hypothetical protein